MIAALAIWHASLVEMIWTTIGLVGLFFTRRQLHRTSQLIEATRKFNGHNLPQHRELRIIAYGHFRNAMFRLAKTLTLVVIGVFAMILPNTNRSDQVTPVGVAISIGFFMISLLIVIPGILDERQAELMADDRQHQVDAGDVQRRRATD